MMQDEEASRSRTCILLENEKQNIVASENNLKSMRVAWIHKEKGSGIHQKIEFDKRSTATKVYKTLIWLNNIKSTKNKEINHLNLK